MKSRGLIAQDVCDSEVVCEADVIIIGGGVSGLAAAAKLQERGLSYIILEGADRIGGRLCSKEWNGATIEAGAQWVTGCVPSNPIYKIAVEQLGLDGTIDVHDTDSFVFRCCTTGTDRSEEGRKRKDEFEEIYEEVCSPATFLKSADLIQSSPGTIRDALDEVGWAPKSSIDAAVEWLFVDFEWGGNAEQACYNRNLVGNFT